MIDLLKITNAVTPKQVTYTTVLRKNNIEVNHHITGKTNITTSCEVSALDVLDDLMVYTTPKYSDDGQGKATLYRMVAGKPIFQRNVLGDANQWGFGAAVATNGNLLFVGSPNWLENKPGVVYVYSLFKGNVVKVGQLHCPVNLTKTPDKFGASLQVVGGRLWVGNPGIDEGGSVTVFDITSGTFAPIVSYIGRTSVQIVGEVLIGNKEKCVVSVGDKCVMPIGYKKQRSFDTELCGNLYLGKSYALQGQHGELYESGEETTLTALKSFVY